MDTNFINVANRGLSNTDDFVTIGELQRTPAVIPSKTPGLEAVIVEAATAGASGSAGAYDDLRAQLGGNGSASSDCEPELSPRDQALKTNEEVEAHNEKLDQEIADLELQERHLKKLFKDGLSTGDGVLTYEELVTLSMSEDGALAEAATWLMGAFEVRHALPRKGTLLGGDDDFEATGFADKGGIDVRASQSYIAQLSRQRRELEGQYQKPVEVPEASASDASAAGAAPGGGKSTAVSSSSSPAPMTPSGNLEAALGNVNNAISSLEQQIAAESDKAAAGDANAAKNLAKLQAQLQTLTSVATILASMLSNLAKVYSDMAMAAVRNMK